MVRAAMGRVDWPARMQRLSNGPLTRLLPDGSERTYQPLWWLAGRFAQVLVQTGDEPLTVQGAAGYLKGIRLTNRTYHFAAEFAEVGG